MNIDTSGEVAAALDTPGWCVIRSAVLGEDVLWLRDNRTPFPREVAVRRLTAWTRAELDALLDLEVGREELAAIARVKRAFPGATLDQVRLQLTAAQRQEDEAPLPVAQAVQPPQAVAAPRGAMAGQAGLW